MSFTCCKNVPFLNCSAGEVVEGEKGRHSFIHNIGQTIIGFIRKDTSSSDYNRLKYQ